MHEPSKPGVVGYVQVEHVSCKRLEDARRPRLLLDLFRTPCLQPIFAEAFVPENRKHVFMAGDELCFLLIGQNDAVHRSFRSKSRIKREWIRLELGACDVDGWNWRHD